MNRVFLIGRLTADPEVRYSQQGTAIGNFTLAINRTKTEADFIPIVVFKETAERAGNSLQKGHRCALEGRLQIRSYETNDGQKRRVAEVVAQNIEFLERKPVAEDRPDGGQFGGESFAESEFGG